MPLELANILDITVGSEEVTIENFMSDHCTLHHGLFAVLVA